MKAKHIGNCLIIAGAACLFAGMAWLMYLRNDDSRALNDSEQAVKTVISQAGNAAGITDESGITTEPAGDFTKDRESGGVLQLSEVEVDGVIYVGYLSIPSVDLTMAVTSVPNDEYLRFALCRYYGSPYTSDLVICGHNYRSAFGKIKDLNPGDEIFFTDMDGNVTAYKVMLSEVLAGTDVDGMTGSDYDLSLYTCTYGGKERYTVRCSAEQPVSASSDAAY